MRGRTPLFLVIVIVLVIIVLAQNGTLGALLDSVSASLMRGNPLEATLLPTGQPLVLFQGEGNQALPPSILPTAYAPAYPTQARLQQPIPPAATLVPPIVISADGQCIAPSGWVAYAVQAGETLADIAQRYNLTAEQMAASNCLQNPDLIYEAQVLAVPGTP
jgi:LysM repeat protein